MCTVGNLCITGEPLSKLDKSLHKSALPNIEYNFEVLFYVQPFNSYLFTFLWTTIVKLQGACDFNDRSKIVKMKILVF